MELMIPGQYKKLCESYTEAKEERNLDEARRLNQLLYEDLFLKYQNMINIERQGEGNISRFVKKIIPNIILILKILKEEGMWITENQQNNQGENK